MKPINYFLAFFLMISGCQNKKSEPISALASIDAKAGPNEEKRTENREIY